MTTMSSRVSRKRHKRARIGSSRSLRRLLACLGGCALAIGAGLCAASCLDGTHKLGTLGVVYLVAGAMLLALRSGSALLEGLKKRGYRRGR
jgi:hypothetical protein